MPRKFTVGEYINASGRVIEVQKHHVVAQIGNADVRLLHGEVWESAPDAAHCDVHPDTLLVKTCPKCLGAAGGRVSSPAKIAASRANAKLGGKLGGRPPRWEATVVDLHDQVRTVVVTGRTRKIALENTKPHTVASDVITKLVRATKRRVVSHSPACDTQTTGRYTEGCPGCLDEARAVTAAQHQAEAVRARRKKGKS
jgi:hypothetical protein